MNTERNWLAIVSTAELEAKHKEGNREADFVEADAIVVELKARRAREQNVTACAEAARSDPNAADRFSLSI